MGRASVFVGYDDIALALGLQHGLEIVNVVDDPDYAGVLVHLRSDRYPSPPGGVQTPRLNLGQILETHPAPSWWTRRRLRSGS